MGELSQEDVRFCIRQICWNCLTDAEADALALVFPYESDKDYLWTQEQYYRGAVDLLWIAKRISDSMKKRLLDLLKASDEED